MATAMPVMRRETCLSWSEVRARAAAFAEQWQDANYEKGETRSFYDAFSRVFGVQRRSVARYEAQVTKLDNRSGFMDLFWPGVLLVEQKSAGRDLIYLTTWTLPDVSYCSEHHTCKFRTAHLGHRHGLTVPQQWAAQERLLCSAGAGGPGDGRMAPRSILGSATAVLRPPTPRQPTGSAPRRSRHPSPSAGGVGTAALNRCR